MTRAQSEVIGFVLVFSLIVASTGIVYVAGFGALQDARTAEQLNNVERAFEILDDNNRDLARRGAPTRATEIDLAGGGLRLGDSVDITVTATNASNASDTVTVSRSSRPVVYEKADRQVVYAYGATFRQNGENAAMVGEPGWVVDERRSLITLVTAQAGEGQTSVGGQTTVLVRTQADSRGTTSRSLASGTSTEISVTVESPRAAAWGRFLERRGFTAVDPDASDDKVEYETTTDGVVIQVTTTSVEFDL
ncbi:MAG: hypothetical protein ABEJ43_01265 [Haloferacaceae archaeon]